MRTRGRWISDFGLRIQGRLAVGRPPAACHVQSVAGKLYKAKGWRASEGPIMKDEPNLPIWAQVGTGRGTSLAGPSLALIAPNKPNLPSSETKGKCFEGNKLWLLVPAMDLGKTKPNLGTMGYLGDVSGRRIVRNEANLRRAWRLGVGPSCQTKPICPAGAGRDQTWGSVGRRAKCAERTQCPPSRAAGAGPLRQTKPICADGWLYKQTQFREIRRGAKSLIGWRLGPISCCGGFSLDRVWHDGF